MNTSNYRVLKLVADLGNVTRVAEVMNYTQPNISRIISSYEKEVGFLVFIRTTENLKLTENGKILYNHWARILTNEDALERHIQQISGMTGGTIKIGALASTLVDFVPEVINQFSEFYPNINISISERSFGSLDAELLNGEIDIAIVSHMNVKKVKFIPLYQDKITVIMHKNHPLAKFNEITYSQLSGCKLIAYSDDTEDETGKGMNYRKYNPIIRLAVQSDTVAISMVQKNLGIYFLPSSQLRLLPKDVTYRNIKEEPLREVGLAVASSNQPYPALSQFIEIAKNVAQDYSNKYMLI